MTRRTLILIVVLLSAGVVVTCFSLGRGSRATTTGTPEPTPPASSTSIKDAAAKPAHVPVGDGAADEHESPVPGDQPGDVPYSQTIEARVQWETVVVSFGHAFATAHKSTDAAAWRAGLHSLVTPALNDELATTDPAKFPFGTYDGWRVLEYGETHLTVRVAYGDGRSVWIELITDGQLWVIATIEPD